MHVIIGENGYIISWFCIVDFHGKLTGYLVIDRKMTNIEHFDINTPHAVCITFENQVEDKLLEIMFHQTSLVTGIVTQGDSNTLSYLKKYKGLYYPNGKQEVFNMVWKS